MTGSLLLFASLAACGSSDGAADPGPSDSSSPDASLDAGMDSGRPEPQTVGMSVHEVHAEAEAAVLGVWEAGDGTTYFAGGGAGAEAGAVWRSSGGVVQPEVLPPGPALWWIWGHGDAVWACGEHGRVVSRRGEGSWRAEETGLEEKAVLWGLWGSSAEDLWAVGGSVRRGGPKGLVLRSTGDGQWSRFDHPSLPDDLSLYKVWGTGPTDVHLVGEGGLAFHWDGETLRRFETPVRDLLFTVHGAPPGPVLAVGGLGSGRVLRFAGDAWVEDGPGGIPGLNGVFVRADGSALAVGERGLVLERSQSGEWSRWRVAPIRFDTRTLHAVSALDDAWLVGGDLFRFEEGIIASTADPQREEAP